MREAISREIMILGHAHRQYAEEALSAIGLHAPQEQILFLLHREDGLTSTQLAAQLVYCGLATVVKTVQRMERAGFVVRRPDPTDRRAAQVFLTEHGRALYAPALQIWHALTERTVQGMPDVEQALFRRLLQQAVTNLTLHEDRP